MPLRRWPLKTILKTGFYVSVGLVTVIYTFLTFQTNFIRLEIDTAIIEPILASADGKLQKILAQPGELLAYTGLVDRQAWHLLHALAFD